MKLYVAACLLLILGGIFIGGVKVAAWWNVATYECPTPFPVEIE